MLFVLSPAKSLDYEAPAPAVTPTSTQFNAQSKELIALLRALSVQQVAELMDLSDKLAALNVARYAAWSSRATAKNARPAVFAFDGDVYDGLAARSLGVIELQWAQEHLCILSGLYGVLRPLDMMQPYRLEMGTALANAHGGNLYKFWGDTLAKHLNQRLKVDGSGVLVNLASQEYFKAANTPALKARVVECQFQDYKNGQYKVISFNAKRARGAMARYAITHRLAQVEDLRAFDIDGYRWDKAASSSDTLVFRRKAAN
ncbi:peroxide stress protein YaaA [Curvibacter sp. APW13]|uniref:peroxide stress protein YaaA n=1 Tax=Curvibacter sp. APW13 TaxID=3077236 RepID=UPI0028DDAF3C|nr:peroxide stress protein YaaA [Curvibacter sp. APW13]MDT8991131.1 peroxide stress protein YaaA [Curvibacter sp. APW13]